MLFAAFEKKWWKALIGDQDMSNDENSEVMKVDEEEKVELETVALVTSSSDWKASEEFIEEVDHKFDADNDSGEEEEENEDVFVNASSEFVEEGTFDLDGREIEADDEYYDEDDSRQERADIENAKEFFNTEVLYRFDILSDQLRKDLSGRYRVEIRGDKGGVWTLDLNEKNIEVKPQREEAELVLMLNHDDFLSIVNGYLNPQIALVSQRIRLSGDSKKASLFQNIMSPMFDY